MICDVVSGLACLGHHTEVPVASVGEGVRLRGRCRTADQRGSASGEKRGTPLPIVGIRRHEPRDAPDPRRRWPPPVNRCRLFELLQPSGSRSAAHSLGRRVGRRGETRVVENGLRGSPTVRRPAALVMLLPARISGSGRARSGGSAGPGTRKEFPFFHFLPIF